MGLIKALFFFVIILLLFIGMLFVDFVYDTFSFTSRDLKADAVVVLTGGRGRVEEGIKLYKDGKGGLLFLIGVDPLVQKRDLYKGDRSSDVYLEKQSRNTLENAIYARELIAGHKVNSITLITSRYHMKRAMLIFRNALAKDVAIYPHPVDTKNLKEKWWVHGGSSKLIFSEFYKYAMFRFFFLVAPGELRPGLEMRF